MKLITLFLLTFLLSACSTIHKDTRKLDAQSAKAAAILMGDSSPLYDHYEACLNTQWYKLLNSGNDVPAAYTTGVDECSYELSVLCDFYSVSTCKQDAEISHRLLFSEVMQSYKK